MADDGLQGRGLLLDACCLINLFASRRIEAILSQLPASFHIADAVMAEALFILPDPAQGEIEPQPVSAETLISAGLVARVRPETESELAAYVDFASVLDDGEAMTCALASLHGYDIATDERKAIRVLRERAPHVAVHTTPALIRTWIELAKVDRATAALVVSNIETRGRFRPGRHEPLQAWWQSLLQST
jgi:hypothetical protein